MKSCVINAFFIGGFLLLMTCGWGQSVSAQDSKISEEEFDRVRSINESFLLKEPHRIRYTHETFPSEYAKQPEEASIWIVEFLPPDRKHYYYGLNSKVLVVSTSESLSVQGYLLIGKESGRN